MSQILQRTLNIEFPEQSRTVFLWGARKTGKSTLLKNVFKKAYRIDLLSQSDYFKYLKEPWRLYNEYNSQVVQTNCKKPLIIDEIQKVPALLDEVHRLIEDDAQTMVLCGSSARKLKRSQSNLLGGRAWKYNLFPFTSQELGVKFNLNQAMNKGLIPDHYFEDKHLRSMGVFFRGTLVSSAVLMR
ncbi:MAG: AAA family ATPase [Proteobacteria bacterium]|nr:AAA family ATPase [Pseudomonadota bacterium]